MTCLYANRPDMGECRGVIAKHRPFRSSGIFEVCERHVAADAAIEARAGTEGFCNCGHPVISSDVADYRRMEGLNVSTRACIIHQPRTLSSEQRDELHRRQSEIDDRQRQRDYEEQV